MPSEHLQRRRQQRHGRANKAAPADRLRQRLSSSRYASPIGARMNATEFFERRYGNRVLRPPRRGRGRTSVALAFQMRAIPKSDLQDKISDLTGR